MTRGTYVIDRRMLKERLSKISELGGEQVTSSDASVLWKKLYKEQTGKHVMTIILPKHREIFHKELHN